MAKRYYDVDESYTVAARRWLTSSLEQREDKTIYRAVTSIILCPIIEELIERRVQHWVFLKIQTVVSRVFRLKINLTSRWSSVLRTTLLAVNFGLTHFQHGLSKHDRNRLDYQHDSHMRAEMDAWARPRQVGRDGVILTAGIQGLVYGAAHEATGSITAAWALHAVNNLAAQVLFPNGIDVLVRL